MYKLTLSTEEIKTLQSLIEAIMGDEDDAYYRDEHLQSLNTKVIIAQLNEEAETSDLERNHATESRYGPFPREDEIPF